MRTGGAIHRDKLGYCNFLANSDHRRSVQRKTSSLKPMKPVDIDDEGDRPTRLDFDEIWREQRYE